METTRLLNKKILIVDDEPDICELLKYNFEKSGAIIKTATNGVEAVKTSEDWLPDLILMDIMMPIMDGIVAGRIIKDNPIFKQTPLVYLTSRNEEFTELYAFEIGAEDFVQKPIKILTLLARIEKIFQKKNFDLNLNGYTNIKNFAINENKYEVTIENKTHKFPKKEFKLMLYFFKNPNKVFSRNELLSKVWGENEIVVDRTVDVHIRKIREKIGDSYIKTLKGVGYYLEI